MRRVGHYEGGEVKKTPCWTEEGKGPTPNRRGEGEGAGRGEGRTEGGGRRVEEAKVVPFFRRRGFATSVGVEWMETEKGTKSIGQKK